MFQDNPQNHNSTLMPNNSNSILNSPGSSVFDFPVQAPNPEDPAGRSRQAATSNHHHHHHHQRKSRTESADTLRSASQASEQSSFLVVSGGTGGNAICSAFANEDVCYVIPVSDDGGSSSEIIRVLGGPSIGVETTFNF